MIIYQKSPKQGRCGRRWGLKTLAADSKRNLINSWRLYTPVTSVRYSSLKNSMCKQQSTTGVLWGCMQKCTVQETTRECIKSVRIDSKKHYWTETCPPPCTMHHVIRWLLTLFLYLKVDFLYFYWENFCLGEKYCVFLLLVTITEFIVLFSHWKSFKMKQNAKLAILEGGGSLYKMGVFNRRV